MPCLLLEKADTGIRSIPRDRWLECSWSLGRSLLNTESPPPWLESDVVEELCRVYKSAGLLVGIKKKDDVGQWNWERGTEEKVECSRSGLYIQHRALRET